MSAPPRGSISLSLDTAHPLSWSRHRSDWTMGISKTSFLWLRVVIARNGRPAAKLVPMDSVHGGHRIGVAKGKFEVPDTIDAHNEEVARLFRGGNPS